MSKQDRQGVRTAADIERKYNFGKSFAEVMGIATEAQDAAKQATEAVGETNERLLQAETSIRRNEQAIEITASGLETVEGDVVEQKSTIYSDMEQIIISALESYSKSDDLNAFKDTVMAQLKILNDQISINFQKSTAQTDGVSNEFNSFVSTFSKFIRFDSDTAITIGSGDSAITLEIDNETGIVYMRNGAKAGEWKADYMNPGNLVIDKDNTLQIGNFGYTTLEDGSLTFGKVG